MKWWLIVNVFSVHGHTQFDLSYDSYADCRAVQVATAIRERIKGVTAVWTLECREFPLQLEVERGIRT